MVAEVVKPTEYSKTPVSVGSKEGLLLATTGTVDSFDDADFTIHVIGKVRSYGSEEALSAKQIREIFTGNVEALYALIAGSFVIVISCIREQKLLIINDHVGSVPFYYTNVDGRFLLSSSMALIEKEALSPLKISSQAIYHYCYFHCIPAPITIYQKVKKLTPAECICLATNDFESVGTLYCPDFASTGGDSEQEKVQCLEEIETAVKNGISENCGAFLSGGLDSSTVSGMLAKLKKEARTFSVGFKEPGYDETEFALITAKHFQTKHESVYLEPDYISDNFANVATSFDEPFGNSSALAAYFCASYAKAQGVNTLLAGDGGDEFFAGNARYAKQKLFLPFEKSPKPLKSLLKFIFLRPSVSKLPLIGKISSYITQAENPLPDRLQAYNFLHRFSPNEIFTEAFLSQVDTQQPIEQLRTRYKQANSQSQIDKMLYLDWKFTLADNDLIKVSKMCEKAGVKVVFPFIEKELVDFSTHIPAKVKLPGQKLRHFFKETTKNFLAPETLNKAKHGFGLPFGRWMRNTPELVAMTEGALTRLKSRGIVRSEFIDKALKMQSEEHSAYYGELIWILSVLELWLESRDVK